MALNFPDSPTLNQEVELGGKTYRWDGVKWRMVYVVTPTAQSLAPTITEVSVTETSITFTITNNDTDSAVILYEVGDNTPDENSIELAASATSSNITVTGLSQGTEYTVSATASVTSKVLSNVTSLGITTNQIIYTNATGGSAATSYSYNITIGWIQPETGVKNTSVTSQSSTDIIDIVNNSIVVSSNVIYLIHFYNNSTYLGWYESPQDYTGATTNRLGEYDPNNIFIPATANKFALSFNSTSPSVSIVSISDASGVGVVEYDEGGKRYRSHTFVSSGTFVVTQVGDADGDRNKVDYLIIAGGGGGAGVFGGGGGAGGYRTTLGTSGGNSSAEAKVTVTAQAYSIVVGSGGAGTTGNNVRGFSGNNSSAFGIESTGGGGGGPYSSPLVNGGNGGSGGGGHSAPSSNGSLGGSGIAGQGFDGGDGPSVNFAAYGAGGGGGAGQAGENGTSSKGGNGGNGLANLLRTGSNETRAGGGGGGTNNGYTSGTGGSGGGGNAGAGTTGTSNSGFPGTVNTGGGGGGVSSSNSSQTGTGGTGGSGIVIIRYEIAPQ